MNGNRKFHSSQKCETSSPGDAQDGGKELLTAQAVESYGASQLSQNPFDRLNYPGVSMNYLISSRNSSQSPAITEFSLLAAENHCTIEVKMQDIM